MSFFSVTPRVIMRRVYHRFPVLPARHTSTLVGQKRTRSDAAFDDSQKRLRDRKTQKLRARTRVSYAAVLRGFIDLPNPTPNNPIPRDRVVATVKRRLAIDVSGRQGEPHTSRRCRESFRSATINRGRTGTTIS